MCDKLMSKPRNGMGLLAALMLGTGLPSSSSLVKPV